MRFCLPRHKARLLGWTLAFCTLIITGTKAQDIIWEESFSAYANLTMASGVWTTSAFDTDDCGVNCGTNWWGVYNGAFRCNDIEGPGSNCQNYLTTSYFDISGYSSVNVSADFWSTGALECPGNTASDDIIKFEYRIDGGPWTLFEVNGYTCGAFSGINTAQNSCLSGDSIALRVMVGNKANDENTYFDNLRITGYDLASLDLPDAVVSCLGSPVWLSAGGGGNYSWFVDTTLLCQDCDSVLYQPVANHTWVRVEFTDSGGCYGVDSLEVGLAVMTFPAFPAEVSMCPGDTISVEALPGQSWLWSTGSDTNWTQVGSGGLIWLQVTDSNGCTLRDTVNVTLSTLAAVDLGPDTVVCTDEAYFLFIPNTFDSYVWGLGSTVIDTGTAVIAATQSGTYWVRAEEDGCELSDTVELGLMASLSIDLGSDTLICDAGEELLWLNAGLGGAAAPAVGFLWQDGSQDSVFAARKTGKYFVYAYNQCDTVGDTVSITFGKTPAPALNPHLKMCPGDSFTLDPGIPDPQYFDFRWSDGTNTPTLKISGPGTYTVTASSACGAATQVCEVELKEWPAPALENLSFPCAGFEAELAVSGEYDSILWSTASEEAAITVFDTGLYYVDVMVCDSLLRDFARVVISTDAEDFARQLFPNVITPNGDRVNDEFRASTDPALISDYELSVYDRWGSRVFQTSDAHAGWDGTTAGDRQNTDGVYFYTASFVHECVGLVERRGSVTVIR